VYRVEVQKRCAWTLFSKPKRKLWFKGPR